DNYTTNYLLPDGSTGQIVAGTFDSSQGSANLIDGEYTLSDGTTGNLYGSDGEDAPDTAALPIPTQYTAAGTYSVLPATALGQVVTITSVIPGTTVEPSTAAATTVAPEVSGTSTIRAASTRAESTIPGTTVAAETTVITSTVAGSQATGDSAGAVNAPNMGGAAGLGFLLYAIFGM
ncbi:MAG: hypothetical protein Q9183_005052, partial [Haloplaca sp. 2 TL-2023]